MSRVVVAMSGGVDSSVAAALAVEAGHQAFGVTLKLLPGAPTGFGCCGSPRDLDDARRVCETLGIPHYVLEFDKVFEESVVDAFVEAYVSQRTPNPCVECNRSVKFGALLRLADAWKADFVATGHYARTEAAPDGGVRLLRSLDPEKDQTYFLHSLTQRELVKAMFPIGGLVKSDVRARARALGLPTADKEESQEICFVPGGDYRAFVRGRAPEAARPGDIRDAQGRKLGTHEGLYNYTIGQRKGLGFSSERPLYVTGMDAATNTLLVGEGGEAWGAAFIAGRFTWTAGPRSAEACGVRVRHRGRIAPARWAAAGPDRVRVDLAEPLRALAPGQSAVLYNGEEVLGGGTIEEVL